MPQTVAQSEVCCPLIDPGLWDEKEHVWEGKPFIKGSVRQLFHMPLPGEVGRTMTRLWKTAEDAGAAPPLAEFIILAYDPTPWKSEFYLAVTRPVPGAENAVLSGTFVSRVFDGPYNAVPRWIKEMDRYLAGRGKTAQRYLFYFTSCPKCAKLHGHNYTVAFAQMA